MIVPFIFFLRRNLEETEEFASAQTSPEHGRGVPHPGAELGDRVRRA